MSKRGVKDKKTTSKEATPKWYLIGLGGCGCNIIDDVLSKREKLKKGKSYSEIFEIGIFDWWVFNTNIADLKMMDAIAHMNFEDHEIADRFIIAHDKHKWVGAGGSPEQANQYMRYDCSQESSTRPGAGFAGYDCRLDYILDSHGKGKWRRPQGVLAIHGVGKGTGCGATPPLIEHLKRTDPATVVFALTIFPFKEELESGGWYAFDTLYGLTQTCKNADALFLVGNSQLELLTGKPVPHALATIVDTANNVPKQKEAAHFYRELINPPLLNFIETLTVPSLGSSRGLTVDIADVRNFIRYHSIGEKYGIIVPLYHETSTCDVETEVLLENAMGFSGQLIGCKPETAAGAYIILVGNLPRFKYFKDILRTPELLSKRLNDRTKQHQKEKGVEHPTDIRIGFAITNERRIRILILLANPEIPTLRKVYKTASAWINEKRSGEILRPTMKTLFEKEIDPAMEKIFKNLEMRLDKDQS